MVHAATLLSLVLVLAAQGIARVAEAKCQTADGLTLFQVLDRNKEAKIFPSLIRQAGLVEYFNDKSVQLTVLVPMDYAFGNLLPQSPEVQIGFADVFPGEDIPGSIVNLHTSLPVIAPSKMGAGVSLESALVYKKERMEVNITDSTDPLKPLIVTGPINSANMIRGPQKNLGYVACNSVIYYIDEVLLPAEKIYISKENKVTRAVAEKVARTFTPLLKDVKSEAQTPAGRK